jgi:hypothetical protein
MKLALDTNTYRLVMEGQVQAVALARRAERLLMPVPVLAELRFGFLNGTRGRENEAHLLRFLDRPSSSFSGSSPSRGRSGPRWRSGRSCRWICPGGERNCPGSTRSLGCRSRAVVWYGPRIRTGGPRSFRIPRPSSAPWASDRGSRSRRGRGPTLRGDRGSPPVARPRRRREPPRRAGIRSASWPRSASTPRTRGRWEARARPMERRCWPTTCTYP